MSELEFRPGRCENPACRRLAFYRSKWLSIERGNGKGHGYHVCRECLEEANAGLRDLHNRTTLLLDIANGLYERSYGAGSGEVNGELVTRDRAREIIKAEDHSCPYCAPCPTHGY